ncbi:2-hydroxyacyl-CoA lyase 1-like, partial [Tropilaelaps mercedesae]
MSRMIDGARVLVEALQRQGIEYMFGVVGVPVFEISMAAQQAGLKFIGMRNEQAAAYAAGAIGYLTRRPGVCLTVSGPGVLHAIGGLVNAQLNGWPMILVGGASERQLDGVGGFQEYLQATREALFGRPGATYINMPADLITGEVDQSRLYSSKVVGESPVSLACPQQVARALDLLRTAKRPLIIVGKGCAYACAEKSVRELIEKTGIPYLPTPMGKGLLPDNHPQCIGPARTKALQEADAILLLGARTNWMLHFAKPPRFNPSVKLIQVEIKSEEFDNSVPTEVALHGDVNAICGQLRDGCSFKHEANSDWFNSLRAKMEMNAKLVQ